MERERIEKVIKEIPPAPKDVVPWILNHCIKETYLIYSAPKNKAVCTRCGAEMSLDKIGPNVKHNGPTICPHCKTAATFKNEHIGRNKITEYFRVVILTRKGKAIYTTITEVVAKFEAMGKPTLYRDMRQIIKLNTKERINLFYHLPWCFGSGGWEERKKISIYSPVTGASYSQSKFYKTYLYDVNIKERLFEKTDLRYAMIPQLLDDWELTPDELVSYMDMFLRYPSVELLIKFGIKVPILNYIDGYGFKNAIHWSGKTITKMLRCNMAEAKEIRDKEVNLQILHTLRIYKKAGIHISIEAAELIWNDYRGEVKADVEYAQIANYLADQNEKYSQDNSLRDYRDYKRDCEKIGYEWRRKRNRFPSNFFETHMRVAEKVEARYERLETDGIKNQHAKFSWIEYEENELFVRIAQNATEIQNEGRRQSHCVAGYAKTMAEGRCIIAFIRKKDEPEKSYYTVELSPDLDLRQCRGRKNCNTTKEVMEFVERWMDHIQNELKREKDILQKRSA